jgi:DNA replication protein DnaD
MQLRHTSPRNANFTRQKPEKNRAMVSKAFKKCVQLIEEMLNKGYTLQIPSTEVERLIKISIGAGKRTVKKYTQMLTEDLAFLKTVTKTVWHSHLQNRR